MFGGNISQLLEQAKKFQEQFVQLQQEAETRRVEGSAGAGMVRVTMNGAMQVLSLTLEQEIVNPNDVGMLQDLIIAAMNDALRKTKEIYKEEASKLAGGLPISGLFR